MLACSSKENYGLALLHSSPLSAPRYRLDAAVCGHEQRIIVPAALSALVQLQAGRAVRAKRRDDGCALPRHLAPTLRRTLADSLLVLPCSRPGRARGIGLSSRCALAAMYASPAWDDEGLWSPSRDGSFSGGLARDAVLVDASHPPSLTAPHISPLQSLTSLPCNSRASQTTTPSGPPPPPRRPSPPSALRPSSP